MSNLKSSNTMFTPNDAIELESGQIAAQEAAALLQKAINTGTGWELQGSYGRSMMQALESGHCMLGHVPGEDAFGNRIPSRSEIKEGTKGSRQYVVDRHGEDWAVMLEAVGEPIPRTTPSSKP